MIILDLWKNNQCSKPPTRNRFCQFGLSPNIFPWFPGVGLADLGDNIYIYIYTYVYIYIIYICVRLCVCVQSHIHRVSGRTDFQHFQIEGFTGRQGYPESIEWHWTGKLSDSNAEKSMGQWVGKSICHGLYRHISRNSHTWNSSNFWVFYTWVMGWIKFSTPFPPDNQYRAGSMALS